MRKKTIFVSDRKVTSIRKENSEEDLARMIVSKLVRVCNQGFESLRLCMHYYVYCAQNVKCCYFSMINIDKFKQWQIKFSESCKRLKSKIMQEWDVMQLFTVHLRWYKYIKFIPKWLYSEPSLFLFGSGLAVGSSCVLYSVHTITTTKICFIFEKPLTTRQCQEICWNFFPGSHIIRLKWFWR